MTSAMRMATECFSTVSYRQGLVMAVKAARRSADRAFIYFEGDDYVVRKSRLQTSALFAKHAPFVTGSYLDEVALAAECATPAGPLVVLGGGFGSTFPLCFARVPGVSIVAVDSDAEVAAAGAHFCGRVLAPAQASAITWRVAAVEQLDATLLAQAGAVFIDLYTEDAMSPRVFDARLHQAIGDQLVFINVFDARYPSATDAVLGALAGQYASFLVRRQGHSSVVVCSRRPVEQRLDGQWRSAQAAVHDPRVFELAHQLAGAAPLVRGDSLIARANREIAALSPAQMVELLRVRSAFLDF
jgi:hypothetical protein